MSPLSLRMAAKPTPGKRLQSNPCPRMKKDLIGKQVYQKLTSSSGDSRAEPFQRSITSTDVYEAVPF